MGVDYCLVNHNRKIIWDMGRAVAFFYRAKEDKVWVTDRMLLQVLIEEICEEERDDPDFKLRVESRTKQIWDFVEGAKPDEVEMHFLQDLTEDLDETKYDSYGYIAQGNATHTKIGLPTFRTR